MVHPESKPRDEPAATTRDDASERNGWELSDRDREADAVDSDEIESEVSDGDPLGADRYVGAILGAAVADALALGHLYFTRSYLSSLAASPASEFARHHSGFHPLGQFGDDAQVILAVLDATIESAELAPLAERARAAIPEAAVAFDELLPLWKDQQLIERDASCAEAMASALAADARRRPRPLAAGRAEASPIGRALPAALWNYADGDARTERVAELVELTHTDGRVKACAAAFGAAVAYAISVSELLLGDFLDAAATGAASYDAHLAELIVDFPRVLSMAEFRVYRHFEDVYPDERYAASEDGLGTYCVPTLLSGIYAFLRNPTDYAAVVDRCIRLGGQMDTAAVIGGALAGAFVGCDGIPESLAARVVESERIERSARRLHELRRPFEESPAT